MKQLGLWVLLLFIAGVTGAEAQKKEVTEVIKKQIALSNQEANMLIVKNVFGDVTVEGYSGNQIILEVEKKIFAKSDKYLELGKSELTLEVIESANRVVLHPMAPYMEFDGDKLKFNWCGDQGEPDYQHRMDFTIKVPNAVKLDLCTVNDGEVTVRNTKGAHINAENINGGITLDGITGQTRVHCINGEVNITYADNPKNDSEYFALNGDINVHYKNSLSANISFKSMNGEMYTDFDINKQFMKTNKSDGKKNGPKFKYEAKPVVQIGSGQVDFDFETLNGDVFIKKI